MTTTTVKELRHKVGEDLGTSAWHTVDQQAIDLFARVTRDEQWIHMDTQRAARGPFGGPIAHGFLTLSLCSWFLAECLAVDGVEMVINYGLNRVRFPAPVPAGARVRGHAHLLSLEDVPNGAQAVIRITVETDGWDKPSCVAEFVVRYHQ